MPHEDNLYLINGGSPALCFQFVLRAAGASGWFRGFTCYTGYQRATRLSLT